MFIYVSLSYINNIFIYALTLNIMYISIQYFLTLIELNTKNML